MWWLKEIFSSMRFLLISGSNGYFKSKRMYEFILPSLFAGVVFWIYWSFPNAFIGGFVTTISKNVFQFMVFVVPFHLAALGAFSTFDRPILDEKLPGTKARLRQWSNQDQCYHWPTLTLRQYVSLLFGYLCTLGIAFIIVYILFSVLNFQALFGEGLPLVKNVLIFGALFFIAHYALLSIYGITFLFDKINGLSRKP